MKHKADSVADLYGRLAAHLERIVRLDIHAPDAVIEDACQFAWTSFLHHRANIRRDAVLAWLRTTAEREAVRLLTRSGREVPLESIAAAVEERLHPGPEPHEHLETRERLSDLKLLPTRQQRLVWLHAAGLSYEEMARHERCTTRTVERQLLRAKHTLRPIATR